jgi:hypothetical protein
MSVRPPSWWRYFIQARCGGSAADRRLGISFLLVMLHGGASNNDQIANNLPRRRGS